MTLLERYLNYLSQICEGSRTPPEGILLTRTGNMEKAIELQQQIAGLGIPEFVKRCAAQDGEEIPAQELESFDASQMLSALTQMDAGEALPAQEAPVEEEAQPEPVKTEIRDIYEVFLDSVCLMQEGQRELAAALLSGDETTFKLFRTQAPELVHLPDATYEWYAQNYLDRYYPVRFILRMNGVVFPELTQKEE